MMRDCFRAVHNRIRLPMCGRTVCRREDSRWNVIWALSQSCLEVVLLLWTSIAAENAALSPKCLLRTLVRNCLAPSQTGRQRHSSCPHRCSTQDGTSSQCFRLWSRETGSRVQTGARFQIDVNYGHSARNVQCLAGCLHDDFCRL